MTTIDSGNHSQRINTSAVQFTESYEIKHSLMVPDRLIFGQINRLEFIAKVESGNKSGGIRGGKITELHVWEFGDDLANSPVAVFKRKQWLVEIPENRRALVETLISYLNTSEIKYDEVFAGLLDK